MSAFDQRGQNVSGEQWNIGASRREERRLLDAIKPFVSEQMKNHTATMPDATPVRLEISGRNGYGLTVTLKELRALWDAYENSKGE